MPIVQIHPADLPRLAECAREFYSASQFLRGFDLDRFVNVWTTLIESGTGVIFAIENDGAVSGTIGGVVYQEPYSGESIAVEFFWYVLARDRGPSGIRLYRAFEDWARAHECSQIRMVHLMDSMPEKLSHVYRRLGFCPAEVHYIKSI